MGENQNPPELYPGHAEELRRHLERIKGIEAAAREPLPGPLLEAYAAVPVEVAGIKIRPLVRYDWTILTRLQSPIIDQIRGKPETPYTDEQAYEMVWHFSRPCITVAAELEAYGREERKENPSATLEEIEAGIRKRFRQRAVEEIAMTLDSVQSALLVKGVEREILRSFSTAIKYTPRRSEGENFTVPPIAAKTDSVGGSITSLV